MIALVDTFTGAAGGGGGAGSSPTGGVHRTAPTSMYDTQQFSPAALSATGATPGPGGYTRTCTHGPIAHMRPGYKCSFCGHTMTATDLVVPGVSATCEGAAVSWLPVLHSGHTSAAATLRPTPLSGFSAQASRPSDVALVEGDEGKPAVQDGRGVPHSGGTQHGAPAHAGSPALSAASVARMTDPDTAHQAAWTATNTDHRTVYTAILAAVHEHGPLTDYHLSLHVTRRTGTPILRTSVGKRRGELRDMGLMCNSGYRAKTDTNTTAIRWALTPAGERAALKERAL